MCIKGFDPIGAVAHAVSGVPILGSVANAISGGINEVTQRPGDMVNNPGQFFGKAALGAAPFLAGPLAGAIGTAGAIPAWASTAMGMGGGMLAQQGAKQGQNPYANSPYGQVNNGAGGGGGIGGAINQFTSPFGVKMFSGGQYPDAGLGDVQLGVGNQLQNAGTSFLNQGAQLPNFGQMGAYGAIPGMMNQMAQMAGVNSPFGNYGGGYGANGRAPSINGGGGQMAYTGGSPTFNEQSGTYGPSRAPSVNSQPQGQNPYALGGWQQYALNQGIDQANQGTSSQIDQMQHKMNMQGITDPRAMAAYQAQMTLGNMGNINQMRQGAMQNAYQGRMGVLNNMTGMAGNLGQAQLGQQNMYLNQGQGMLGNAGNIYGQGANRAIGMYNTAQGSAGSMAGLLAGNGLGANPIGGLVNHLMSPNTWKTGGGGGQNPYSGGFGFGSGGGGSSYSNDPFDPNSYYGSGGSGGGESFDPNAIDGWAG